MLTIEELFEERSTTLQHIKECQESIKKIETQVAKLSAERDGFSVGDVITEGKKKKIIVGFDFWDYKPNYILNAARIKKDGTPYNESNRVYGVIEQIS